MRTPTCTVAKGWPLRSRGTTTSKTLGGPKTLRTSWMRVGIEQLVVVGPHRQRLVFVVGVGAEQRDGLAVADVDVVDGERVAIDRLDHGLQCGIVAHGLRSSGAQLAGIVGIDGLVAEAGLERILQRKPDLLGHHVVGVVRLLHRGVQQLAHVDQRNQPGDEKYQRR